MYLVRPIEHADLPALEQLAAMAPVGTTTLPKDRDALSDMIGASRLAFQKAVEHPGAERYFFVICDAESGQVHGISGLEAAVGIRGPFYSYREDSVVHASGDLHIHNRIPALHLCQDYTGATLVSTLFAEASIHQQGLLPLLSLARFSFMAAFRERFASTVISEIRGVVDEDGSSPFWESLGRHFFSMDFARADRLTSVTNKAFIADLMPRYPVYVPLLSDAAQDVLGVPHDDAMKPYQILENEGFRPQGYIDIFDGGPTLECQARQIRTLKESDSAEVVIGEPAAGQPLLISNGELQQFRCLALETAVRDGKVTLSQAACDALGVSAGQRVRLSPMAGGWVHP
ncbi:arginine N-succinyltransferase [Pokkaliibacter sp. CJK22405]|uniref:arginine N-succinyltransferase n=1 Tax=Pokkaliibacter sp. CJK22405 TaxID=3384615 RepID=UPI003984AAE4